MKSLNVNRNLQFWKYSPSFSRLLLVANKESTFKDRIALVFQGTWAVNLPTNFYCDKIEWVETSSGATEFKLTSKSNTYSIKALRMDYTIDELEFDAPIPLFDNFFDER